MATKSNYKVLEVISISFKKYGAFLKNCIYFILIFNSIFSTRIFFFLNGCSCKY